MRYIHRIIIFEVAGRAAAGRYRRRQVPLAEVVVTGRIDDNRGRMPLALDKLGKGTKGRVVEVTGGRSAAAKLSAQGIVPGAVLEKTSELRGGPVLVKVGGTQVAIGRGLARRVLVEVLDT